MISWASNGEKVEAYVESVLSGEAVVGQRTRDACQRYRDDCRDGASRGLTFDPVSANRACRFIELLTLSEGEYAGMPFDLKPWQAFIVWNLFGWKRQDGTRRFRDAFITVARGNGKSEFAAALLMYLFYMDSPREPRSECYSVATKRDQAWIVFDACYRYVSNDEALRGKIRRWKYSLTMEKDGSFLKPLSSEAKSMDGLKPHGIVRDELHAWREQHRETLEKLDSAMGKRRQPMSIAITTAGSEESLLWREQYDFSCSVVDRDLEVEADSHFAFIAEIDEEDDPLDPEVWPKANPMLEFGIVKRDHLEAEADKARIAPVNFVKFKRYHANRFATSLNRAIPAKLWAKGGGEIPDLGGRECFAGLDWGLRDDLSALALVFPLEPVQVGNTFRRRYALKCWAWCPEEGARELYREPWDGWIADGHLTATQGNNTDPEAIWLKYNELREMYHIRSLAADKSFASEFLLRVQNLLGDDVYEFPQTCARYNEPMRELILALDEGRILHGNENALLGWSAANMITKEDSRAYIMPNKQSSLEKIDPIVAVIMALGEAIYADQVRGSFYDSNEVEVF